MNGFEHINKRRTKPIFEGDFARIYLSWNECNLFVLHVDTFDGPNTFGEIENLKVREWFSGVPTNSLFPHQRWIETFFNRGPDREGRCEIVAINDQV